MASAFNFGPDPASACIPLYTLRPFLYDRPGMTVRVPARARVRRRASPLRTRSQDTPRYFQEGLIPLPDPTIKKT